MALARRQEELTKERARVAASIQKANNLKTTYSDEEIKRRQKYGKTPIETVIYDDEYGL